MRISSDSGWWNLESSIFRRKSSEKRWSRFLSMPFFYTMTGCWLRSTTRMAPKLSGLRTLWRLIAEKKVCVCEATKAPVELFCLPTAWSENEKRMQNAVRLKKCQDGIFVKNVEYLAGNCEFSPTKTAQTCWYWEKSFTNVYKRVTGWYTLWW